MESENQPMKECVISQQWRFDDATPKLLFSNEIDRLSVEEFKRWLEHIKQHPAKYAKAGRKLHWLSECGCIYHNRSNPENARSRIEAEILNHTKTMNRDRVSLLSMGSGGLFQDFIILSSLLEQGFKEVSFCFVEPSWKRDGVFKPENELLMSLIAQFKKTYPSVKIHTAYAPNIQSIPSSKTYDIVYAIDMDNFQVSLDSSGWHQHYYQGQISMM